MVDLVLEKVLKNIKKMKFKEIYDRILPLWGNNINFSDAETTDGSTTFTEENFFSKKMEKKWDEIQENVGEDDTYGDLMVWTMFVVFQRNAAKLANQNINYFKSSSISSEEIEAEYYDNLQQDSWEEELAGYERE